jgi:hypothetical protein
MVGITRMKKKDVQTLLERDGAGHTYMKSNIQERGRKTHEQDEHRNITLFLMDLGYLAFQPMGIANLGLPYQSDFRPGLHLLDNNRMVRQHKLM